MELSTEESSSALSSDLAAAYELLVALAFADTEIDTVPSVEESEPATPGPADAEDSKGIETLGSHGSLDGFSRYRDRINRIPLLEREDEVRLAEQIEAGVLAKEALENPHSHAVERDLRRLVTQGAMAYEAFVSANLRLVVYWAVRSRTLGLDLEDAVQEGNLGLIKAVQMFDWRKGYKFSTYASWWIKQHISRAVADKSRAIRLPVHVHERVVRLRRALGSTGPVDEIPAEVLADVGLSSTEAQDLLRWSAATWSLDDLLEHEFLLDVETPPGFEGDEQQVLESVVTRTAVAEALEALSNRDREIIVLRFGLAGEPPRTLEEIGVGYGLTRERIRQIENKAKERLATRSALQSLWLD